MRFETSQSMKLGQHMKLAPRMIQSMEILQLPMMALEERIAQELEGNVTLETFEPGDTEAGRAEIEEQRTADLNEDRPLTVDEQGGADEFARLERMEESYTEAFENEYSASSLRRFDELAEGSYSAARSAGERDGKMDAMANAPGRGPGLTEQLLEQWAFAPVDEDIKRFGEALIEQIDEDGYIKTDLATIADRAPVGPDGVKPTAADLERAILAVQVFLEPSGLGARDTRECLLLQLDALAEDDPDAETGIVRRLISEHLDDVVHNRLPKIVEKTGLSIDAVNSAIASMRRLSVAPARRLSSETPSAIVPDAMIEFDEEQDRYIAIQTDGRLPNLRINREYAEMVRDRETPKETKEFVKRNLTNAHWLIDALQQRRRTLQRVLNVVVDAQRDFFDYGPQSLKPLPMTQVADQLGLHVATISRAVADKHVLTPRGVMPLRRFFTGGTQTESGEDVSWEAIRVSLQEVVDAEDKKNPLSDEALAEELKKRGVEIARRTIAKYRAQLNIPSARMRKQF